MAADESKEGAKKYGPDGAGQDGRPLVEALKYWAATQPTKRLFTYLGDGGEETKVLTYAVSK